MSTASLRDRRILVVEDECLLAADLKQGLQEAGAVVLGPVPSAGRAGAAGRGAGGERAVPTSTFVTRRSSRLPTPWPPGAHPVPVHDGLRRLRRAARLSARHALREAGGRARGAPALRR
jgi:hypothetical protein